MLGDLYALRRRLSGPREYPGPNGVQVGMNKIIATFLIALAGLATAGSTAADADADARGMLRPCLYDHRCPDPPPPR